MTMKVIVSTFETGMGAALFSFLGKLDSKLFDLANTSAEACLHSEPKQSRLIIVCMDAAYLNTWCPDQVLSLDLAQSIHMHDTNANRLN